MSLVEGSFGYYEKDGELLLILRKNDPYRGTWCFPGGEIEEGESPEFALKREIKEETSLEAVIGKKIGEQHFKFNNESFLVHVYRVISTSGKIEIGDDVDDVKYIKMIELDKVKLAPPIKSFLKKHSLYSNS